ncbi:MAG: LysM peptidoglycan-binding domain-containing protein [Candidatus Caenarcaniphilales bacterium]|nr:LysM peptidoglycan-binding domain-containing protein [Candidatus Caenarcaniphilales bacterium]
MISKKKFTTLTILSILALGMPAFADAIDEQAKVDAANIIKTNDTNADGKLSVEEVDFVFKKTRFPKVDKNADGLLDQDELTQSYANAARARAQRGENGQQQSKSAFKKFIDETKESIGLTDKSPNSATTEGSASSADGSPPGATSETKPVTLTTPVPASNITTSTHVVKQGESIYSISKKYNVNQQELMVINGIQDESKISIGKELIIPTSQASK